MSGTSFMADSTDIESILPFDTSLLATPPGFVAPIGVLDPSDPVQLAVVPEPDSFLLVSIGLFALLYLQRRKSHGDSDGLLLN